MSNLSPMSAAALVGIVVLPVSLVAVYFAVAGAFVLMDPHNQSNSLAAIPALFLAIIASPVCAGLSAWFTFKRLKEKELRTVPPPPFPSQKLPPPPV